MKEEEAKRVSVNHCVRDDEIEKMVACIDAAAPGEWYVRRGAFGPEIQRFDGDRITSEASFAFMAKARSYVPRLIKGIGVLENALTGAWAEIVSWRSMYQREKAAREADAVRRAEGKTGPENNIRTLASLVAVGGCAVPSRLEQLLREWTGGADINHDGGLDVELRYAEKHAADKEVAAEEDIRLTRERLRVWADKLDRGEVPEAMAKSWKAAKRLRS